MGCPCRQKNYSNWYLRNKAWNDLPLVTDLSRIRIIKICEIISYTRENRVVGWCQLKELLEWSSKIYGEWYGWSK